MSSSLINQCHFLPYKHNFCIPCYNSDWLWLKHFLQTNRLHLQVLTSVNEIPFFEFLQEFRFLFWLRHSILEYFEWSSKQLVFHDCKKGINAHQFRFMKMLTFYKRWLLQNDHFTYHLNIWSKTIMINKKTQRKKEVIWTS